MVVAVDDAPNLLEQDRARVTSSFPFIASDSALSADVAYWCRFSVSKLGVVTKDYPRVSPRVNPMPVLVL